MNVDVRPIGWVHCAQQWHFDAPRQPGLLENRATIEILPEYRQALTGLHEFSRIWVVFLFHQAAEKLMIRPPRLAAGSVGAFACRSPHRPNRLGISAVLLRSVQGARLEIREHDFIDGTPVLDIKPYLSCYDRFDLPVEGWLKDAAPEFQVVFAEAAVAQLAFLAAQGVPGLQGFLQHQLSFLPDDAERKRVAQIGETEFVISYRTWRARYTVDFEKRLCAVTEVFSGWSEAELAEGSADPWQDKALHRAYCEFCKRGGQGSGFGVQES
jgi:tRNA-Thr(GGU) m(6)t(6)A37 methyltransferase TsaA